MHHHRPCQYVTLLLSQSNQNTNTDRSTIEVYNVSNKLCKDTLEEHGEEYKEPAAMDEGICTSPETPAISASNATSGTAQPTGSMNGTSVNGTSSATPTETSAADFDSAAGSVGFNMAAVAVGGLAFLAL